MIGTANEVHFVIGTANKVNFVIGTANKVNFVVCGRSGYILSFFGFLTLEEETDRLSRNVGKELPLLAV